MELRAAINISRWLWLVMVFGPANPRIWKVLNHFKTPELAYEGLKGFDFPLSETEKSHIYNLHIEQAENLYETYLKQGYNIVTFEDENYPDILKQIANPPAVLFTMGKLNINEQNPAISMVGARNCSRYSVDVTAYLSAELSKLGFTIVSGFARGIDFAAHSAATALNKPTVAVLGTGLDIDYPSEHADFKYVIRDNGGCVISEYFLGTRGHSAYFPIRNRIISGISRGTVIIEAKNGSGSLLTANYAIEQNRDLFCVSPANIFSAQYAGVIKYLRDGAVPVYSYLDIAREYIRGLDETYENSGKYSENPVKQSENPVKQSSENKLNEVTPKENKAVINQKDINTNNDRNDINENKRGLERNILVSKPEWKYISPEKYISAFPPPLIYPTKTEIDYSLYDDTTLDIIKFIEEEPVSLDEISENLDIGLVELMEILDGLLLDGVIKETEGKLYEIRS
jgi:DNA processing protein